jgi:hypothetical protein
LHSAIKSYEGSTRILKSTWLVQTEDTAEEVYEELEKFLEKGSHLLVIEVKGHYRGELDTKACKWMSTTFS